MNLGVFLLYLCTWLLVALTPGPAVMCSMNQSVRFGFKAGLVVIAGIQAGNFLFFAGAAFGLLGFLAAGTKAFSVLRIIGAFYLFVLGSSVIMATFRGSPGKTGVDREESVHRGGLFFHGWLVQITNPKALLFVSALLPQFVQTGSPLLPQLMTLALTTVVVDTAVLSSYAFLAERGVSAFRGSGLTRWLQRMFGAALVFFGARLLAKK